MENRSPWWTRLRRCPSYVRRDTIFVEDRKYDDFYLEFSKYDALLRENPNDIEAMFWVGLCLAFERDGAPTGETRRGFRMIDRAAKKGCSMAVFQIANVLDRFGQNPEEARWWYNKAAPMLQKEARSGSTECQWLLGRCYCSPLCDLPYLPGVIAELWEEATRNGHVYSPYFLACRNLEIRPVDIVRVYQLIRIARSRGLDADRYARFCCFAARRSCLVRVTRNRKRSASYFQGLARCRNRAERLETTLLSGQFGASFIFLVGKISGSKYGADRIVNSHVHLFVRRLLPILVGFGRKKSYIHPSMMLIGHSTREYLQPKGIVIGRAGECHDMINQECSSCWEVWYEGNRTKLLSDREILDQWTGRRHLCDPNFQVDIGMNVANIIEGWYEGDLRGAVLREVDERVFGDGSVRRAWLVQWDSGEMGEYSREEIYHFRSPR